MTVPPDSRHILLLEDDPDEFESAVRALRDAGLLNPIVHCTDGGDALAYLKHTGEYADPQQSPRPAVVLIDASMPRLDGLSVLAEMQRTPELADIPVIALTSGEDEAELERYSERGASAVIRKPMDLDRFLEALRRLENYWFEVVLVPRDAPTR